MKYIKKVLYDKNSMIYAVNALEYKPNTCQSRIKFPHSESLAKIEDLKKGSILKITVEVISHKEWEKQVENTINKNP